MFLFLPEFPAIQGFEDNHIGQNKSLCLLDLIYYSIRLDLSIIISFLLRCKTSKIMITFKNFSRCVIFCYICHWILANPINNSTLFCLFCISISILNTLRIFRFGDSLMPCTPCYTKMLNTDV